MTDYSRPGNRDLSAVTLSTGVIIPFVPSLTSGLAGCTLPAGTFYFPIGSNNAETPMHTALVCVQAQWAAAVAGVMTVEFCNFPSTQGNNGGDPTLGPPDVTDFDAVAGNWVVSNPSTAIVDIVGSGNSATAATVTAGGTAMGGAIWNIGNYGARRMRLKMVLSAGGLVRVNAHGKFGV